MGSVHISNNIISHSPKSIIINGVKVRITSILAFLFLELLYFAQSSKYRNSKKKSSKFSSFVKKQQLKINSKTHEDMHKFRRATKFKHFKQLRTIKLTDTNQLYLGIRFIYISNLFLTSLYCVYRLSVAKMTKCVINMTRITHAFLLFLIQRISAIIFLDLKVAIIAIVFFYKSLSC